jgi:hypothetical protein
LYVAALFALAMLISARAGAQSLPEGYGLLSEGNVIPASQAAIPATPSYHILPAHTAAGRNALLTGSGGHNAAVVAKPLAMLPKPGFYPADVTYMDGPVMVQISSVNVYVNCADESCWGDPEGFQANLAISKFIHVVDQYVGKKTNNRYPLDLAATQHLTTSSTSLTSTDINNFVDEAAAAVGSDHIFNIFLPEGTDVCLDTNVCYSPDNSANFVLCAYHSYGTFTDLGPSPVSIAYTVQPYQNVTGCMLAPPNPNSPLIDSTNSSLSHELFETISDPFLNAWIADSSLPEQGNEIADICHGPGNDSQQTIAPEYVLVKGHTYQTQLEYSNTRHGCVVGP